MAASVEREPTAVQFSKESGEATRWALLRATVEIVSEQGWDGLSTRAIAQRAGVNQGLIHYHFGSKAKLLHEAFTVALRETFGNPGGAVSQSVSVASSLASLIRALEPGDSPDPVALFSAEAMARATRDPEIRDAMADGLGRFRSVVARRIEEAQRAGELPRTMDPVGTATALGALLDGLGLHVLIDPTIDVPRTASAVAALLDAGPAAATALAIGIPIETGEERASHTTSEPAKSFPR